MENVGLRNCTVSNERMERLAELMPGVIDIGEMYSEAEFDVGPDFEELRYRLEEAYDALNNCIERYAHTGDKKDKDSEKNEPATCMLICSGDGKRVGVEAFSRLEDAETEMRNEIIAMGLAEEKDLFFDGHPECYMKGNEVTVYEMEAFVCNGETDRRWDIVLI